MNEVIHIFPSIGYSYLQDPLLCLLLESLEAITWNFARISHVAYANELGTKLTVASIQGLLSATTFGLSYFFVSFSYTAYQTNTFDYDDV